MYEGQTYEVILKRMLDNLPNDIDKREGSVAYDMLAPKAAELSMVYIELDNLLQFGFVDTTYGSFLDSKVLESGVVRNPAVKAKGVIKFTGDNGFLIPAGTVVYTTNDIRFLTDANVTISGGIALANITAEVAGFIGNVPANAITQSSISTVTCTNEQETFDGADIETDAALLERYLKKVKTPSVSGNIYDYMDWATSVSGIGYAKVSPLWNGNGTVKVIVVDDNKNPVTAEKIVEVFNKIETERPIGATVTVESATNKVINIAADITVQSDQTIAGATTLITQKIEEYFSEAGFVDPDIKHSKIGAIILQVQGVTDYTNLTLNGVSSNVVLATNEVPALGTVTFT